MINYVAILRDDHMANLNLDRRMKNNHYGGINLCSYNMINFVSNNCDNQGLVKGEKFCFRNLEFYFRHGESESDP